MDKLYRIPSQITTDISSVKIWDNLIDDRFLLDLDEESNTYNWNLNNIANRYSFPYEKKGSHLLWGTKFSIDNCPEKIHSLCKYLLSNIIKHPYKVNLVELNAQSLGQEGTVHIDSDYNSGERTLMVFFNYKWEKNWGGEFQLLEKYDHNSKIIKNIEYIPGRVVIFDGNIPHRGLAPKIPNIIRKSLVFRLAT